MKKILLFFTLLISVYVMAQKPANFVKMNSRLWYIGIGADSSFAIPKRDTNYTAPGPGYLTWRPADSLVYYSTGRTSAVKWVQITTAAISNFFKASTVATLRTSTNYGVDKVATTAGFWTEGDGGVSQWYWDASSGLADNGVDVIKPSAFTDEVGRWRKLYLGSVRAIEVGIKYDGTDQTAIINTVAAITAIKEILFDNPTSTSVTISGATTIPAGKKIVFKNDNKIVISGAGSWTGGIIDCDPLKQCFSFTTASRITNLDNNEVYLPWFGAVPDNSTDIAPSFRTARDCMKRINITGGPSGATVHNAVGTIYIPRGHYRSLDSIWFDKDVIRIIGMGAGRHPVQEVRIRFPQNKPGFKFVRYPTGGSGCRSADIENLYLYSEGLSTDTAMHGIETNCLMTIRNIGTDNFGGNGIYLNTSGVGLPAGDCSNSIVENHTAQYCLLNGMYIRGEESSNIQLRNCNWKGNGLSGLNDAGFLGNLVVAAHAASNGFRPGGLGVVSYNGDYYASIKHVPNVAENINKEPGAVGNEDWWQMVNGLGYEGVDYHRVWNDSTPYPVCAPYAVSSVPANTTFLHCYAEAGTAGVVTNAFSIVISGDIGTGMARPWMMWFTPQLAKIQSPTLIVHNTTAGDSSFAELSATYSQAVGVTNSVGSDVIKGALKYNPSTKQVDFFTDASVSNNTYRINTSETSPTPFGLSAIKTGGFVFNAEKGLYLPDAGNSARIRNIIAGLIPPIAGEHVAGDIVIYTGTDTTISHYLCTVSGTPGTWQTIRTGSGGWNLGNTNLTLLNNRTLGFNGKTLTFSEGSTYQSWNNSNFTQFVQKYGSTNIATISLTSSGSGATTALTNYDSLGNNMTITMQANGAGRNIFIGTGDVGIRIYKDSVVTTGAPTSKAVWSTVGYANQWIVGNENAGGGQTYKALLTANSIPILWNLNPQTEMGVNGLLVEQGGKIGFDGSLESVYMKSISSNSLAVFTPFANDTLAVFDSVFTLPGQADYAEAVSDGYAYFNKNGTLLRTDQNPFAAFYFSLLGTLDPYGVSVNDSTFGIKSGRVEALNNKIAVTSTITANENKYQLTVNTGPLGTGTPTANKFLAGDSVWRAVTLSTDVTGTLPIANGGTGQTTANAALNAFLPTQTGNAGKILQTDGTNTSWEAAGGGLPALTSANIWVGNGSNVATAVSPSGDWTIDNAGVNLIGNDKITTVKILADNVTLAKIVDITAGGVIGNIGTTTQNPQDIAALVVIGTGSVSAAATMDVVLTGLITLYDEIQIHFYDVRPATDNANLCVRVSTDGGSTYDATAANYEWGYSYTTTSAGGTGSSSATQMDLVQAIDNAATTAIHGVLYLHSPDNTAQFPHIFGQVGAMNNSGNLVGTNFYGVRKAAQDTDAIRFIMLGTGAGNMTGKYKIMGVRKPGA